MVKHTALAFFSFFSLFSWGIDPIGHKPVSSSTIRWSFDRTATNSHWDIAKGAQHEPLVSANQDQWHFGVNGLTAGEKIKLTIPSYQLWLLLNSEVSDRKQIPINTSQLEGRFRLTFIGQNGTSSQTVRTENVLPLVEPPICESHKCIEVHNPHYNPLVTASIAIPADTLRFEITPVSVKDGLTGKEKVVSGVKSKSLAVTYHIGANPVHIVGVESLKPLATDVRQFSIIEPFPIKLGSQLEINVGNAKNARPFALLYFNPALSDKIKSVPVCYDRLNPKRVHHANGNDVRIVDQKMHLRTDGGNWQTILPSSQGIYRVGPIQGRQAEFNFEYALSVDLRSGLGDINRCYQIGSDFEWVPSQPGVAEVSIGSVFDAPNGNPSKGWQLQLN